MNRAPAAAGARPSDLALAADLDVALAELRSLVADPAAWTRGRPGKWNAGQHVDHVRIVLERSAGDYEARIAAAKAGTLPEPPRRGFLERLWVNWLLSRGLPRGGKTPKAFEAGAQPVREAALSGLADAARRMVAVGASLTAEQRERLWAPNPFMPRWHYRYDEMMRVQAVHARHHAKLVAEA